MKAKFVITNISPFFKSKQKDSVRLTPQMREKYSGINCTITFKKVINIKNKTIEDSPVYMHHGNSNPKGVLPFSEYVNGVIDINGKQYLDSDKIISGAVLEIEYVIKIEGDKKHLVPSTVKVVDFINVDKAIKTKDKIHTLDF